MLELDEVPIFFTVFHEFTMIPACDDSSGIEHIDTIDMLYRGETMGDDDTRTSLHEMIE